MIDEARTLEHSGPGFALLRWGASMKQLILYVILANVLVVPWGLAGTHRLDHVVLAIGLLFAKALGIGAAVVVIESSFAKLRLYKIPEFTVGSFLLAVLAVITFVLQRDYGETRLTVFGGIATVVSVIVLLLELMLLRSQDVWEQLRLYGIGSAAIAIVAFAAAPRVGGGDLYAIGAITIAFKALIVPIAVGTIIRNLDVPARIPSAVRAPSAILLGIVLSSFALIAVSRLRIGSDGVLPLSALGIAVAVIPVAFLLMILRPYAPSQLIGFLTLENGVTLAALVIAPGLPLILALLLLFDVAVGLVVFVLLVQYFGMQRTTVTTDVLDRLRG